MALGVLFGVLGAQYLSEHGIQLTEEQIRQMPFAMGSELKAVFTMDALVYGLGMGAMMCFVGTMFPALRASAVEPAEAMRVKG